jgi:hypothetical protein
LGAGGITDRLKKGYTISEQEIAKKEVLKVWRSCVSSQDKGRAMSDYLKKYCAKSEPKPSMVAIFDGGLPLEVCV